MEPAISLIVAALVRRGDHDGFVRAVAWIDLTEWLDRLRCVEWYDCVLLERFLSREAPTGAVYTWDRQ